MAQIHFSTVYSTCEMFSSVYQTANFERILIFQIDYIRKISLNLISSIFSFLIEFRVSAPRFYHLTGRRLFLTTVSSLNPLVYCFQSHTVMTNPNNQHVCFTNPQRIMQKKTRSKNNRQPRIDDNTRGHLKKIVGVNSNKWQKYKRNRKYNTRTREHIARNYIKIMCTYAPEDKE